MSGATGAGWLHHNASPRRGAALMDGREPREPVDVMVGDGVTG